jgi:DNA-binding NarL/FixJ family response regulator
MTSSALLDSVTPEATPAETPQPVPPITVAVVEDDRGTRDQLVALLAQERALMCVGAFADAEAALRGIPAAPPDVALVDINLPGMSGIECVAHLTTRVPSLRVLMLTAYKDSDLIFRSLRAGARGYLLKKLVTEELVDAVAQVHAGGAPMSMQIASQVVAYFYQRQERGSPELQKLTQRENEILALLAQGLMYKEIVDRLGISMGTVRTHLQRIYDKLHVNSRTEAAAKFYCR